MKRSLLMFSLIALGAGLIPEAASAQWYTVLLADTMSYRSVSMIDRNQAWMVGFSGSNSTVQYTPDGGYRWGGGLLEGALLFDVETVGQNRVMLAGISLECNCGLIGTSTDGGATWSLQNYPDVFTFYDITYTSPTTGFLSGTGGIILRTTDAGKTWKVAMAEGDDVILDMTFPSKMQGYAVAGADNDFINGSLLYSTADGGTTWTESFDATSLGLTIGGVAFSTESTGLMAGYRNGPAIFITTDRGITWSEVFGSNEEGLRLRSVTWTGTDTAYAAGDRGVILASYDGGYTWQQDRTLLDAGIFDVEFENGVGWGVGVDGVRFKTVKAVGPEGYCLPPVVGPTYGSGIDYVGLDAVPPINRSSLFDELYTWVQPDGVLPTVRRGNQYTVSMATDPSNLDGRNTSRAWIDFNRDGDFDDEAEEVGAWDMHELATEMTATFTVPLDAVEGQTIMRVYTDMPSDFGHDEPNPCGYVASENVIGHHGEVEDYSISIINESAASVDYSTGTLVTVQVRDGAVVVKGLESAATAELLDIEGRVVGSWNAPAGSHEHRISGQSAGTYFVRLSSSTANHVARIEFGG